MTHKTDILLIEDNPGDVRLLKEMVAESGLTSLKITVASNLAEGVALNAEMDFDLLLLDLGLPDSQGLETLRRAHAHFKHLPIIVLTGLNDSETGLTAIQEGAQDYLIKGQVDSNLLHRTIAYAIERFKSEQMIHLLRAELKRILESAGEGIIYIDHYGLHRQVNHAAAAMLGYSVEELQNKPSHSVWHYAHEDGTPYPENECPIQQTIRFGTIHRRDNEVFWRKDGSCFPVEYVAAPFGGGETPGGGVVVVFQDITQRKKSEEALNARARQQEAVAELGKKALKGAELTELLDHTTDILRQTLQAEYCQVLQLRNDTESFDIRAGKSWNNGIASCIALAQQTLNQADPIVFHDLQDERRFDNRKFVEQHISSGMSIAIQGKTGSYGVIQVFTTQKHRTFSQDDVNFLQSIANLLGTAIQRKQADDEIERLVTTDELTGAVNRRRFDDALSQELLRAQRYTSTFSLIMYDIDHFKSINDRFGHDVGDEVLKAIVELVQSNIRRNDLQARWGGEEFMIITPETALNEARHIAEKLRQQIENHVFEKADSVTVSMGVTEYEANDDRLSLCKKADEALYLAKTRGRNRVESVLLNG